MKKCISAILLLVVYFGFAQQEIKMPELDTENQVYILKFNPDPENKEVISAYMKGRTEKDSLRFWAEGTILTQRVMVTILTPDKKAKVKVDIVKDNWKDSKISGFTQNGVFQKSFSTANKFGVVVTSENENIEFHLAVWTTGELIPNMYEIYTPISTEKSVQVKNTSTSLKQSFHDDAHNDNTLIYIIIGTLIVIVILLLLLLIRKKPGKKLGVLFIFFISFQFTHAQIKTTDSAVFNAVHYVMENADSMNSWFENARNVANAIEDGLSPSDEDSRPDPSGGPGLPSSCIPPIAGNAQEPPQESIRNRDPKTDGCACLQVTYMDLNRRRLNLERLRIIYKHAMKKINAGIAIGDNVSGVHGVSGLAWQSQKMIILKESIPTLNKAYDDKYAEMIQSLEENLRKIEECETMLGNENWYNQAGFIYYQFMADKYKRN